MRYFYKRMINMFIKGNNLKKESQEALKFEVGEIVVCINDKRKWHHLGNLKKNEMYTISGFNPVDGGLILKEIKSPSSGFQAYALNRFRKVDMSFFDEVYSTLTTELEVTINKLYQIHYN